MPDDKKYLEEPIERAAAGKSSDGRTLVEDPIERQQKISEPAALPENYGFTGENMFSNVKEHLVGLGKSALTMGKDVLFPEGKTEGERLKYLGHKYISAPLEEEGRKSEEAYNKGHIAEGVGHSVASYLPFVGPWASSLGEQAGTGDIGGALAGGATDVIGMKAAPKIVRSIGGKLMEPVRVYQGLRKMAGVSEPVPLPQRIGRFAGNNRVATRLSDFIGREKTPTPIEMKLTNEGVYEPAKSEAPQRLRTAYRAHDAGAPEAIDLERSHAHATGSAEEAQAYAEHRGGGEGGKPQEVSKIDLSQLREGVDYELSKGPNGDEWVKFKTPRARAEFEPFHAKAQAIPAERLQAVGPARSPRGYFNPGRGKVGPTVDEVVNQAMGVKPLEPNTPLREQPRNVGAPTNAAEVDPIKAKYPDPAVRQMVRANGERIVQAIGNNNPELMKQIHDLTRVDLRQALVNAGEDMGQTTVSNSKFAGEGSIAREEAFNRLLKKGHSPAEIIKLAKQTAKK